MSVFTNCIAAEHDFRFTFPRKKSKKIMKQRLGIASGSVALPPDERVSGANERQLLKRDGFVLSMGGFKSEVQRPGVQ
jgi:hypothetical protein